MACCLTGPSHYLNQSWLSINEILRNTIQGNVYLNIQDINTQVVFEICTLEFRHISQEAMCFGIIEGKICNSIVILIHTETILCQYFIKLMLRRSYSIANTFGLRFVGISWSPCSALVRMQQWSLRFNLEFCNKWLITRKMHMYLDKSPRQPWIITDTTVLWPLLLTWFNFNPSMDK